MTRTRPAPAAVGAAALLGLLGAARDGRAEPQRAEAGGFVGVDYFGTDVELGNAWAKEQVPGTSALVGGRGVWWLAPRMIDGRATGHWFFIDLGLEGEARLALSSTGSDASAGRGAYFAPVIGLGGHVILRLRTHSKLTPHLLVGGGADTVLTQSPFAGNDSDPDAYWGAGASWAIGARLALRVDVRHRLTAGRMDTITSTVDAGIGLAIAFGGAGRDNPSAYADRMHPRLVCTDLHRDAGCPPVVDADRDHDGVVGAADRCPDEPETVNGIDDDDGCPESDDDGDGVIGSRDKCPEVAEDRDGFEDDDGCEDPDNDGDGKDDHVDQCPDKPETVNGIDDDDGCPDEVPAALRVLDGTFDAITFDRGKARLTRGAKRALDKIAAILRANSGVRLRVSASAGDGVDDELAGRRADAIKWYLVDAGVAEDRLDASGATATGGAAHIELHLATGAPATTP